MQKFHVTYYYCATGMEGRADVDDFGIVEADSANQAKKKVAHMEAIRMVSENPYGSSFQTHFDWMMGCLDAQLVKESYIRKLYGKLFD